MVTHIGSGFASEIESSLDILLVLVDRHIQQMAPFAVFIKVNCVFIIYTQFFVGLCDHCQCTVYDTNILVYWPEMNSRCLQITEKHCSSCLRVARVECVVNVY